MNAPWKPVPATREPFCAYLCDDATLDLVRPMAIEFGWEPERCVKGGLRGAVQALAVSASPSVLLVDIAESGDPLHDIQALAEVCEPGTIVVAIGQINDVRLYRDLVASGIQDYLLKPLSPMQLRDAVKQALATIATPRQIDPAVVARHASVAVIGARGGVGASTIATSLAWLFSTEHARPTALLDLDVHFGTGALALDLEPGRGLVDAIENPGRIDGLFIERATIRANENLAILSAEAPIGLPLVTDGAAFSRLAEELRQGFAMTVIDLPRAMLVNFPELVGEVNVIVLVTELTLACARDAIRLLAMLRAQAPQAEVIVVANKLIHGAAEIGRRDFEATIEGPIAYAVPSDPRTNAEAGKLGRTFVDASRGSKAAAAIAALAAAVLAAAGAEDDKPARARPSLRERFDFRAFLARPGGQGKPRAGTPG